MQMSHLYESTNRKLRASKMRTDARDCERRGFPGIASVLWESAEWIDPTPREKPEARKPRRTPSPSPSPSQQQRNTRPASVNVEQKPRVPVNVSRTRPAPIVEYRRLVNSNAPVCAA